LYLWKINKTEIILEIKKTKLGSSRTHIIKTRQRSGEKEMFWVGIFGIAEEEDVRKINGKKGTLIEEIVKQEKT
jgi:hypothetical protein